MVVSADENTELWEMEIAKSSFAIQTIFQHGRWSEQVFDFIFVPYQSYKTANIAT